MEADDRNSPCSAARAYLLLLTRLELLLLLLIEIVVVAAELLVSWILLLKERNKGQINGVVCRCSRTCCC
jgi:hypothetical protein